MTDSVREVLQSLNVILQSFKDIVQPIKETKHDRDMLRTEKGYSFLEETAFAIIDTYDVKKVQKFENTSPNKKPVLKRTSKDILLPKPSINNVFITQVDLEKSKACLTQGELISS